jgi:pyridoxine 4-dehydrogenase
MRSLDEKGDPTMTDIRKAGTFKLGDRTVKRLGYGAMQLAGPGVFGPPKDRAAALAVLREAVASGVDPHRHQRLLRPARHQPDHPRGAAPVSGRSGDRHQDRRAARRDASWNPAFSRPS